jgi:hypothetical protein
MIFSLITCASAAPATNEFENLRSSLFSGASVYAHYDSSKCKPIDPNNAPIVRGSFKINLYEWFDKSYIQGTKDFLAASVTNLVISPDDTTPTYYEYTKLNFQQDSTAILSIEQVDPKEYKVTSSARFICPIGPDNGSTIFVSKSAPTPITSYQELIAAVDNGHSIIGTYEWSKCLLPDGPGPFAVSGTVIDAFKVVDGEFVATFDQLIGRSGTTNRFINFGRLSIKGDDVTVQIRYLRANTLETTVNQTYKCKLGSSAFLYAREA